MRCCGACILWGHGPGHCLPQPHLLTKQLFLLRFCLDSLDWPFSLPRDIAIEKLSLEGDRAQGEQTGQDDNELPSKVLLVSVCLWFGCQELVLVACCIISRTLLSAVVFRSL